MNVIWRVNTTNPVKIQNLDRVILWYIKEDGGI
ncbi:hypothetical protein SAMN05216273_105164 [Chryseobacterium taihuense]|uniref:Uncharacterized protein n=1 Tax=Chryseobacterium taihuense TaxID=1141221 RepID=A0ABY0QSK0_9FLAO|nr:hypothetical protein SAMN05216273_105164 [Chryseobacterium taihuense]